MSRSPVKIIELCVYALVIVAAMIWMLAGGNLYTSSKIMLPNMPQINAPSATPPPVIIPRGDVLPEQ